MFEGLGFLKIFKCTASLGDISSVLNRISNLDEDGMKGNLFKKSLTE